MAKEETKDAPVELTLEGGKKASVADLMGQLQKAKVGEILNSEYLDFKAEGEEKRVIFIEMGEIRGKGDKKNQMVPAAKILDASDGKIKINADVVLVSTCQNLDLKGRKMVPLAVVNKGMIEGAMGEYRDLQINELILN